MAGPIGKSRSAALALLASALAGACLVKDVELVESFADGGKSSGGNSSNAGSPSSAGSSSSDGGEDAAAGEGSGGSEPSAGNGGSPAGGVTQGGASGSGGTTSGGMAGMNQGGSNTPLEIPDLGVCGNNLPGTRFCDDFEQGTTGEWPPGIEPQVSQEAPSGSFVLIKDFQQPISLSVPMDAVSISLWAKFDGLYDQRVISFRDLNGQFAFGLGREAGLARWIYAEEANPETIVSPDDENLTRSLDPQQWFCLQIRADIAGNTFEARVVVPGDPPFDLPILDRNPTSGVDQVWNSDIFAWGAAADELIFGQEGAYQQFDDVLIGDYDTQTLCDLFIESGAN